MIHVSVYNGRDSFIETKSRTPQSLQQTIDDNVSNRVAGPAELKVRKGDCPSCVASVPIF